MRGKDHSARKASGAMHAVYTHDPRATRWSAECLVAALRQRFASRLARIPALTHVGMFEAPR